MISRLSPLDALFHAFGNAGQLQIKQEGKGVIILSSINRVPAKSGGWRAKPRSGLLRINWKCSNTMGPIDVAAFMNRTATSAAQCLPSSLN